MPDNPIVVRKTYREFKGGPSKVRHMYWCPGCDGLHSVTINPDKNRLGAGWTFTGTLEKPTYSPSQLSEWSQRIDGVDVPQRCHTFIRDGVIEFLSDCTHELAGRKVPLPPVPDWLVGSGDPRVGEED